MRTVTIVGASLAGLSAARALRAQEFAGRIILVGAEEGIPYDRPPLSKDFLAGTTSADDIELTTADDKLLDIEWHLGRTATQLDTSDRAVVLDTGERIRTDAVVIATVWGVGYRYDRA
ncbi:FAD-dependent oxidoreductase [Kibdelosporangium lantanae]|uniref:FAD-dependent oxidoreductase n=1 Tax=Kibdelosporangium lantanae TaxID=1497396 RepID=A0ABW3MFT6_9PSEU